MSYIRSTNLVIVSSVSLIWLILLGVRLSMFSSRYLNSTALSAFISGSVFKGSGSCDMYSCKPVSVVLEVL